MLPSIDMQSYYANAEGNVPLRDAFTRRRAVMPFSGKHRLSPDDIPSIWQNLLAHPSVPQKRLVYIHVPFCANHCLFCGFYRHTYIPATAADYVERVIAEITQDASAAAIRQAPVHAVYFGGGTPSALSANELSRLIKTVKTLLPLTPDCEITVEGRIIHFDDDKIDACIEAGANRFSIGVQSFDTRVRRRQGRRSSGPEAVRFLEALRDRDRAALIIDLMYGLPEQTPDIWRQDIETAIALSPDGIDLYGLNLIPGTPLFTAIAAGKFPTAPELTDIGAYYQTGAEALERQNWHQLSNNHWARTSRERNLYNLLIKEGADCLAYGAGAGGMLNGHSFAITSDMERYNTAIDAGQKPVAMMTSTDVLSPLHTFVIAAFETGYLDLDTLDRISTDTLGQALSSLLHPLMQQWQRAGLLSLDGPVMRLSTAGRFWYANLVSAFLDIFNACVRPMQTAT